MSEAAEQTKVCTKCGREKPLSLFNRQSTHADGRASNCKECTRAAVRNWYQRNNDVACAKQRQYQQEHSEKVSRTVRDWKDRHPEKVREYSRVSTRKRYRTNIGYQLRMRVSMGLAYALKQHGSSRKFNLVGYSVDQLKAHLESTMPAGYDWQAFLDGKLEIDHVVPGSWFEYGGPEDIGFKACWCLENLRLLPFSENSSRGNRPDADAIAMVAILMDKFPGLSIPGVRVSLKGS